MDGAGFVGGNGKGSLVDHLPQNLLLDGKGIFILHQGKLGIIRGGKTGDIKVRVSAGDMDGELIVGSEYHHIIGHTADNVAKETGIEDDIALGPHLGRNGGADAGLHVVARNGELIAHMEQQTFQRGDGAFGRHCPAGDRNGALQQNLFAAEFDHRVASSHSRKSLY